MANGGASNLGDMEQESGVHQQMGGRGQTSQDSRVRQSELMHEQTSQAESVPELPLYYGFRLSSILLNTSFPEDVLALIPYENGTFTEDTALDLPTVVPVRRTVTISWQLILKKIMNAFGAVVSVAGYIKEEGMFDRCCVRLELKFPGLAPGGDVACLRLNGDWAFGRQEAMENATKKVVKFLEKAGVVVLKDNNYERVQSLQRRLRDLEHRMELYNMMVSDFTKRESVKSNKHDNRLCPFKELLSEFYDVFHISITKDEFGNDSGFIYTGDHIPSSRLEKLSSSLVNLLNGNDLS